MNTLTSGSNARINNVNTKKDWFSSKPRKFHARLFLGKSGLGEPGQFRKSSASRTDGGPHPADLQSRPADFYCCSSTAVNQRATYSAVLQNIGAQSIAAPSPSRRQTFSSREVVSNRLLKCIAAFWIFSKTHRLKTVNKNAASKNTGWTSMWKNNFWHRPCGQYNLKYKEKVSFFYLNYLFL